MDLQSEPDYQTESDGINYLNVSVFFAILSFFILLNVISTKNADKAEKLTESVKQEFKGKNFAKEFMVFNKRDYETSFGSKALDFKDLLGNFLAEQSNVVRINITENSRHYILKIDIFRFFGVENNIRRSGADSFLKSLNSKLNSYNIPKNAKAKIILVANKDDQFDIEDKLLKLKNLQKSIENIEPKFLEFSLAKIDVENQNSFELKNIYITFNKNEF